MLLKENYICHLKSAKSWLLVFLLLIGVDYLSIKYLQIEAIESLWLLIPALLVTVLPGVMVQLWYSLKSRGLKIEFKELHLIYFKDQYSSICAYADIDLVICNKSASYDTGRYTAGLEQFWNLQLLAKDGHIFVVTCLMYSDLDKLIMFFREKGIEIKTNNGSIGFKTV